MTQPNVDYAAMTIADYEPVLALWKATPGMGLSGADTREAIGRFLERNPGMSGVARLEGATVGAALAGHDGRRGYIHHLAVAESCRGRGIGTALTRRCLVALQRAGMQRTHVFVHANNPIGLEYWTHAGWRRRTEIVMFTSMSDHETRP